MLFEFWLRCASGIRCFCSWLRCASPYIIPYIFYYYFQGLHTIKSADYNPSNKTKVKSFDSKTNLTLLGHEYIYNNLMKNTKNTSTWASPLLHDGNLIPHAACNLKKEVGWGQPVNNKLIIMQTNACNHTRRSPAGSRVQHMQMSAEIDFILTITTKRHFLLLRQYCIVRIQKSILLMTQEGF